MFRFRLDGSSGVPPYLQLVHQVRQSLLLGYLRKGDRLPTVKEVVSDLAINPNTVVKAYRQLEHEGLAGGRPGQGTFITATLASPSRPPTGRSACAWAVIGHRLRIALPSDSSWPPALRLFAATAQHQCMPSSPASPAA